MGLSWRLEEVDRPRQGRSHTLSALAPTLSKIFTRGIIAWGISDTRDIEAWDPKLRFLERTPALAGYEKIPSTPVRLIYRLTSALPFGAYDVLNRFEY